MTFTSAPLAFGNVEYECEDTLAFSVLENIRPMIETFPLEQAAEAYARMIEGKARFRVVLVTKNRAA
jgi:alcohol dehydrogenase, propanol-preferring